MTDYTAPLNSMTPKELQNERHAFALNSILVTMAQSDRSVANSADAAAFHVIASTLDELYEVQNVFHPNAAHTTLRGPTSALLKAMEEAVDLREAAE